MAKSVAYEQGQSAKQGGKSADDNPYFGEISRSGVRRYADEQAGSDWACGFRDAADAAYQAKHGAYKELGYFGSKRRCRAWR